MASIVINTLYGITSFSNTVIAADLIGLYNASKKPESPIFPSHEVRDAIIFSLVSSVWGIILSLILPILRRSTILPPPGSSPADAATNFLFVTMLLDGISAALLTKASAHGGACLDKASLTCHLYTAMLGLEWTMTGLALVGTALASAWMSPGRWAEDPEMAYAARV